MMKKLILAAVFSVASFNAAASKLCQDHAELASWVMLGHQYGMPLSEFMNIDLAEGSYEQRLVRKIVIRAYSEPRHMIDSSRLDKVARFRDEIHVECLKGRIE